MLTRPFGRTGWPVSALTFGVWQLGGTWGALDEDTERDALLAAIVGGVTLIDTAPAYGRERSEDIVGRALALSASHHSAADDRPLWAENVDTVV